MNFLMHWSALHLLVLLCALPLSKYAVWVLQKQPMLAGEKPIFKVFGLDSNAMNWKTYLYAFLQFQLLGFITLYLLARFQTGGWHFDADQAFVTAASFVTNTNWQTIAGEMHWQLPLRLFGIITQNFFSAASGLSVLLVFSRCFKTKDTLLGNFWLDIWRISLYLLLPLAMIVSLVMVWQGVPQNFNADLTIQQYDIQTKQTQVLPMGPIASQASIKLLGTNGGSYTAANSAHPLENPTPWTHYLGMFCMLLLPVTGCFLFARINQHIRYGWFIWLCMLMLSSALSYAAFWSESHNLLGKELRIGNMGSVMWHALTTSTATGASAAVIDQFHGLTTGCFLFLMNLGEIAFGGVGMGVVNLMFLFILSSFILSLLTGSAPQFMNNHVPLSVIKLSMFYIILVPCLVLITLILMMVAGHALQSTLYSKPYLISALWYDISSWLNNNGSGFSAWQPRGVLMNYVSGFLMLVGRYIPIIIAFAVCGIFAKQTTLESKQSGFDMDSLLFCLVSAVVIVIVTLLAFLPLWSLGPLVLQG
jgi:K+-transporting ATPase ATPase A chain